MSFTTTSGRIIYSNSTWPGKFTDNNIMIELFSDPEKYGAEELVRLCKEYSVVLIADRGFRGFQNWLATKPEFHKIILKMPVNVEDDDGRYSREDADRSRLEVNSIRDVVERVHGSQDRFSSFFL